MIDKATDKLINKEDLDFYEAKEAFDEIFSGLATSIKSAAFVTSLKSKKESIDEFVACITSANEAIKKINLPKNKENLIQNIFIKENKQYFDFSITNDIICASYGLNPTVYSFNSPFYFSSKFEVLKFLNLNLNDNIEDLNYYENADYIVRLLSDKELYFKYTNETKRNLNYGCIFEITDKILNPFGSKNIYLGIDNRDEVEKYAQILLKLNYTNSIVVSGESNLPFVTTQGETIVAEAWKNKIFTYTINPKILDFKTWDIDKLLVENSKHCASIIMDILNNKYKGAIYDCVILNAALALYITKKASSLVDGFKMAKEAIETSLALEKFNQIKNFYF